MHVENLKKGEWITVTNLGTKTVFGEEVENECRFIGVPMRVKAISYPFVMVAIANHFIEPIDLRKVEITRLNGAYIASYFFRRVKKQRQIALLKEVQATQAEIQGNLNG